MVTHIPDSPSLIVGKSGVTPEVVHELRAQLKKRKIVKIRILRTTGVGSGKDRKSFTESLAAEVGAEVVQIVGRTAVLRYVGSDED